MDRKEAQLPAVIAALYDAVVILIVHDKHMHSIH